MLATAVLALLAATGTAADTARAVGPVMAPTVAELAAQPAGDTVPVVRRRRSVELGDWYERRLRIHRYGSYTMYPLFAFQAVAGAQLYGDQSGAPEWAKTGHRVAAAGLAGVFTVNTVTGLWNLWDSRSASEGRTRRYAHSLLMLASDAGFTYAGVRLAERAENSASARREHRTWAYGSMAAALAGVGVQVLGRE